VTKFSELDKLTSLSRIKRLWDSETTTLSYHTSSQGSLASTAW